MPRYTVKIRDRYFHWSTIVDAPISDGMLLEDFRKWYFNKYGTDGDSEEQFNNMIKLLDTYPAVNGGGCIIAETLREAIRGNRAGENEKYLTANQIYEQYRRA